MAGYGNGGCDRCRFCGLDLPMDPIAIMTHYNNHWRQCNNLENLSLSSCAYEPQLDIRISPTPINPDDLEVCSHNEHNFQYSYSPQTEPSNLSVAGTRCSPLNLTGRSKSESPLASPLPNDPQHPSIQAHQQHSSAEMNIPAHQTSLQNMPMNPNIGVPLNYAFPTHNMFTNCPDSVQMISNVQMNNPVGMSCHGENPESNAFNLAKKRKRLDRLEFQCMVCSRTFFTKESFNAHSQLCQHKDLTIQANSSNYILNNEPINLNHSFQNALQNQMPVKPYKCSVCDQEFSFKEELAQHNNNHLASKPYKCELCGTGLSHLSALKRHSLTHTGHKPHTCEICGRGFFQKCDLQRHFGTHSKKKEVECSNCKKKYSSGTFPKNHKCKPPEEPKPFKCEICGEGCSTNIGWSYHMWKHTKNPIFVPCQTKTLTPEFTPNNLKFTYSQLKI